MKLIKILKNSIISFSFLFFIIPTLVQAAPSFTSNTKKVDLAQSGLNEMLETDLNQDGNIDVIISEYNSGDGTAAVEFKFGDGTGLFENTGTIKRANPNPGTPVGDGLVFNPDGLSVGFIDGDTVLDIAVTAGNTALKPELTYLYKGSLNGNSYTVPGENLLFTLETTGAAYDVVIGHFNTDSFIDIVISHAAGISLFKGTGIGMFNTTAQAISTFKPSTVAHQLFAKDINNDGFLDIVTEREILINDNNSGQFTQKAFYSGTNTPITNLVAVTIADFNNDSILDVAYALNYVSVNASPAKSQVVVLVSAVNGNSFSYTKKQTTQVTASQLSNIASGDIDLDGIVDVIVTDYIQDAVRIYAGHGDGTFGLPDTIAITPASGAPAGIKPRHLVVTEINNDRLLDIITINDVNNTNPSLSALTQTEPGKESFIFGPKVYTTPKPALNSITNLSIKVLRKYISPGTTGSQTTVLSYSAVDGTAVKNIDYNVPNGPDLTFTGTELNKSFNIKILSTATGTGVKDFTIALSNAAGLVPAGETASISILDENITLPVISLSSSSYDRFEDQTKTILKVIATRTTPPSFLLSADTTTTVYLTTQELTQGPGRATEASDYTPILRTGLTLPNMVFTGTQTQTELLVPIKVIDDAIKEDPETFTVSLSEPVNGTLSTNVTATITIFDNDAVTPPAVNNIPVVKPKTYAAVKNKLLTIDIPGVLFEAGDADQTDTLIAKLAPGSALDGLTLSDNGSLTYLSPVKDFTGSVSFDFIAFDGTDNSLPATVTINVNNTRPIANADNYSTQLDTTLNISAIGVLDNDRDENNDSLTVNLASGSSLTGLQLNQDGSFTYSPKLGFTGEVTFQYVTNDGTEDSLPATVTITVFAPAQINFGVFSFDSNNSYTVSEDTNELILNVVRNLGSTGVVTLNYSIKDNDAKAGLDFNDKTATPNTLVFVDGVTSMPITIEIVKDSEIESNEDFLISLTSVNPGVLSNKDTSKLVTITDTSSPPVTPAPTELAPGGAGGGCSLQTHSGFDPVVPLLTIISLLYLLRRKKIYLKLKN